MSKFTSLSSAERRVYFEQYQLRQGVDAVIIEKDFWVVWLLARIFSTLELGETAVFKGGTSLQSIRCHRAVFGGYRLGYQSGVAGMG